MAGPQPNLKDSCDRLQSWPKALSNRISTTLPEVMISLDPATKLPQDCPSHASLALLAFSGVEETLQELTFAVDCVEHAIRRQQTRPWR